MDQGGLPVTPSSDARDDPDIGSNDYDHPNQPIGRPTGAALDFSELALTSTPNVSYDSPGHGHFMPDASRPEGQTVTLLREAPFDAQSLPDLFIPEFPENPTPKPDLGTLSFDYLSTMVVDEVRDALLDLTPDQQDQDALANTTSSGALPRGISSLRPGMPPLRPQPHGVLRLDCSIYAPTSSPIPGMDGVSDRRQDDTNAARPTAEPQLPQGEAESEPPEVVEARPKRRIIKIKSREAVLYLRGVKARDEMEEAIERRMEMGEVQPYSDTVRWGEAQPHSETAYFDDAVWHWDAGFDEPGENSGLDGSS